MKKSTLVPAHFELQSEVVSLYHRITEILIKSLHIAKEDSQGLVVTNHLPVSTILMAQL
jgi:hypothetical protein